MHKKIKIEKGFVLLYVVIISSIILAIALAVSNISYKEIKFGTSAKDTNNAFFAADTGAECAIFNDKSSSSVFVEGNNPSFNCNFIPINATEVSASFWSFSISGIGDNGQSCAIVTVDKTNTSTIVVSKGYNIGGGSGSCNPSESSVERQLKVTY